MRKEIKNYTDAQEMYADVAELICITAREAVAASGSFSIALAGGNTPLPVYEKLLKLDFPWDKTNFFWGDERYVPPDDSRSNYFNAARAFLNLAPVAEKNIHRINTELEPEKAAEAYEAELMDFKKSDGRDKIFDLVLLGMGEDGHTASLFPGSAALNEKKKLVAAVPPPKNIEPEVSRITLTFPALESSGLVFFLIRGNNKRKRLLSGEKCPALMVNSEKIIWFAA